VTVQATSDRCRMAPIDEAAEVIGTKVRNLKRAAAKQQIPHLRIGTLWFVPRAWLASVTAWPPEEGGPA
jgi:hypothetical protein